MLSLRTYFLVLCSNKAIVFIKERWKCDLRTLFDLDVVSNVDGSLKIYFNDWQFLFEKFAHDLLGKSSGEGSTNNDQAVRFFDEILDSIDSIVML